jgi:hypothetical protein
VSLSLSLCQLLVRYRRAFLPVQICGFARPSCTFSIS